MEIETEQEPEYLQDVIEAQEGDASAFGRLANRFQSIVFAIVLRRLRNRSEALEVTQEVLMRAWRKLPQLREPARFAPWLKQIAVRMSINHAIRRPDVVSHEQAELVAFETARDSNPLQRLLQRETAGNLWGCIEKLRELDRRTLIAFYFEGQSLKQMSDQFDSPVGTIKRRLHTARNRLKVELGELQMVG
ncbi:MAG: sigma-70 family RNA polymerase sigma factor [Planctomycetales bacterium]